MLRGTDSESIAMCSVSEWRCEGFLDSDKYTLLSFNAKDKISDPVALQVLAECSPPFPKADDPEHVPNCFVPPNSSSGLNELPNLSNVGFHAARGLEHSLQPLAV